MQIVCSWCGKSMKEKQPLGDKSISHSICEGCYEKVENEIKRLEEILGGKEMEIQRAIQIARREWENIKASLAMCGDIGKFDSFDLAEDRSINYLNSRPNTVPEGLLLVRNLIEMENKLPTYHRYFTPEASYVFTTLASSAGERLGLVGKLAQIFGRGYSLVRTGCFDLNSVEKRHVIKQVIFFKLFFPFGGDCNGWDFNSPIVKRKFKLVFDKFVLWQDTPRSYIQDLMDYGAQLEALWLDLSLALDFPAGDASKEYQKGFY